MTVVVSTRCRRHGVRSTAVRADAARVLRALDVKGELSVVLVDDAEMQALNASYRKKDRPTDVLAFSMRESRRDPRRQVDDWQGGLLGDVVISVDTAARQAAGRGVSVAGEVRVLLVHGILHLLGYDHERSPADARRMFALQKKLLRLLTSS